MLGVSLISFQKTPESSHHNSGMGFPYGFLAFKLRKTQFQDFNSLTVRNFRHFFSGVTFFFSSSVTRMILRDLIVVLIKSIPVIQHPNSTHDI